VGEQVCHRAREQHTDGVVRPVVWRSLERRRHRRLVESLKGPARALGDPLICGARFVEGGIRRCARDDEAFEPLARPRIVLAATAPSVHPGVERRRGMPDHPARLREPPDRAASTGRGHLVGRALELLDGVQREASQDRWAVERHEHLRGG
jgi:hypothetical protein